MATIDGITFNLSNARVYTKHRNIHLPSMNSYINTIRDTGYDGLEISIVGFENTRSVYDTVLTAFMATGVHSLVIDEGWEYRIHSVVLNQSLPTYIVNNHFPYTLTMRTSTPYAYSITDDYRAKSITSNNQEWSAADYPPGLLLNNNFEEWSNGTAVAPNFYQLVGVGATIARETIIIKTGAYSVKLTCAATNDTSIRPNGTVLLNDLKGKTITLGAWVYSSTASRVRLKLYDTITEVYSSYHTGGGSWEWLTATLSVSASASTLYIYPIWIDSGAIMTAYVDGAVLLKNDEIEDNTFTLNIDTDGAIATPVDIQVTSATAPSSEQATIGQLESY